MELGHNQTRLFVQSKRLAENTNTPSERRALLAYIIKQRALSLLGASTVHGIPNLASEDNPIFVKILWLICFLISSVVCGFFFFLTISSYLAFDEVSTMTVISETPSLFPMISMCNVNAFTTETAYKLHSQVLPPQSLRLRTVDIDFLNAYVNQIALASRNDSYLQSFGSPLDEFLPYVLFNSKYYNTSNLSWYYDGLHGNCYQFNSGRNMKNESVERESVSKSGTLYGFYALIYVAPPMPNTMAKSYGAHVIINNMTVLPNPFEGFDIPVGYLTSISVDRIYSHRLSSPYSDCINDPKYYGSELTQLFVDNKIGYTQQDCFNYCCEYLLKRVMTFSELKIIKVQRKLIQSCSCYSTILPLLTGGKKPCLDLGDFLCQMDVYQKFVGQTVVDSCSQDCPLECDSVRYEMSVTQNDWPTLFYCSTVIQEFSSVSKLVANYSTLEEKCEVIRNSYSFLNIYYSSLSYTYIEESPKMTMTDMISNVGGTLGLFLGASFLSIWELFDLVIQATYIWLKRTTQAVSHS